MTKKRDEMKQKRQNADIAGKKDSQEHENGGLRDKKRTSFCDDKDCCREFRMTDLSLSISSCFLRKKLRIRLLLL